jgi:hypothetical protein
MKTTWIAILAASTLLLSSVAGTAQEGEQDDGQPDEEPAEWPLPEDEDRIHLGDLLQPYADHADIAIVFDPKKLSGAVELKPDDKGRTLKGDEIDTFVSDALEQFRYALMPEAFGTTIMPTVETQTRAAVLTEEELASADDWTWGCVLLSASRSRLDSDG